MDDRKQKPLYLKILEVYKDKIENRQLLPEQQLPTEVEMAKDFGVSRITSKRALEELEREGYIYRRRGQGSFVIGAVRGNESTVKNVVAMIVPSNTSEGRTIEYVKGASDLLTSKGYYLSLHISEDDAQKERSLLTNISRDGVCGIIYYPLARNNFDILYNLYLKGYPIVTIDKHFESMPLSYVISDNYGGSYQAVEHLIQLGHKRIGYMAFSHIEAISTVRQRFFGYCAALQENGLEMDSRSIMLDLQDEINLLTDKSSQTNFIKQKLQDFINLGITALALENDYMAVLLYTAISEMGIDVPKDLSLVGFDNLNMLEHMGIMLTTVEQDFYQIGREAAQTIIDCQGNASNQQSKKIIPVKLIVKSSTAPYEG